MTIKFPKSSYSAELRERLTDIMLSVPVTPRYDEASDMMTFELGRIDGILNQDDITWALQNVPGFDITDMRVIAEVPTANLEGLEYQSTWLEYQEHMVPIYEDVVSETEDEETGEVTTVTESKLVGYEETEESTEEVPVYRMVPYLFKEMITKYHTGNAGKTIVHLTIKKGINFGKDNWYGTTFPGLYQILEWAPILGWEKMISKYEAAQMLLTEEYAVADEVEL